MKYLGKYKDIVDSLIIGEFYAIYYKYGKLQEFIIIKNIEEGMLIHLLWRNTNDFLITEDFAEVNKFTEDDKIFELTDSEKRKLLMEII